MTAKKHGIFFREKKMNCDNFKESYLTNLVDFIIRLFIALVWLIALIIVSPLFLIAALFLPKER